MDVDRVSSGVTEADEVFEVLFRVKGMRDIGYRGLLDTVYFVQRDDFNSVGVVSGDTKDGPTVAELFEIEWMQT